ncbi:MAG: hypothetical protein E3J64_09105 [Anaerolineales bacterium]|nr:MAG: hypothetical protein E3J64_09105 [Anaerolineales bacterium]
MPVVTDFPFTLDPAPVLKRYGREVSALIARPELRQVYEAALAEARALIRPGIAYAAHPIVGAEAERLLVADGQALESAVVARLFAGAPEVVLAIYSIGPQLEERATQYHAAGDYLPGFALDVLGSAAVNEVGRVAYGLIEDLAKSKGLNASIPLNPGTSHWPLSGNQVLTQLVPAAAIGIEMLDSGLLRPFKSISFAVALGEHVLTPAEGSSCDYCDTRDLCRQ